MSLVSPEELGEYMNSPQWTPAQIRTVRLVLSGVQSQLEGCLSGARLTPRESFEVAPILPSGLVATRQPVFRVLAIDGTDITEDDPLAQPWVHTEHRLRNTAVGAPDTGLLVLPSGYGAWGAANVPRVENAGQVTVRYLGGWGRNPSADGTFDPALLDTSLLVLAVLAKAKAIVNNRFDDRIGTSSGADNEVIVRPEREVWTADELKPLGIFRNIGAKR